MRTQFSTTLLVLVTISFAGCIDGDADTDAAAMESAYEAALVEGTWPSGQNARDFIESYIMTHPFRASQSQYADYMATARDSLEDLLIDAGLETERHAYTTWNNVSTPNGIMGEDIPGEPQSIRSEEVEGVNILGFKEGTTNPEQWVVLSAHYDSASNVDGGIGPTFYGAWDDGSGTAALIEMAYAFEDWQFPFTVVFAFFDQEEEGLLGSQAFVDEYFGDQGIDILANLNTDPPGLNWPCGDQLGFFSVKIIEQMAKVDNTSMPRFAWLHDAINHGLDASGVPDDVRDRNPGIPIAGVMNTGVTGTSDHASFGAYDIANVFIGGIPATIVGNGPDDYTVAAMSYGLHTPIDTLEQMEARCTVGTLADGLQTTVDIYANALIHMSEHPAPY